MPSLRRLKRYLIKKLEDANNNNSNNNNNNNNNNL